MVNLVIFIIAHPDAHTDDLAVFIYDEGDALYDQTTISKRLKELQITKREGLESGEPIQSPCLLELYASPWPLWSTTIQIA